MTHREIQDLEPWFHNIHLPDGTETAPDHDLGDFPRFKWEEIKRDIPEDLSGWKVLDIGCNAGFYSLELAKRGADVLGIDLDEHYLRQARAVAKEWDLEDRLSYRLMQVYDLADHRDSYDLVWFMGVFYHLRYPLLALDIISQITRRMLVFQSLSMGGNEEMRVPQNLPFDDREAMEERAWPKMAFIPHELANDPTNWWVPNHQAMLSLLDNCGFDVVAQPAHETYVAVPHNEKKTVLDTWNKSEFLAATGRDWRNQVVDKTEAKNNKIK